MPKAYLDPPTLFPSQQYGFSQVVTARGGTTVYLSGQVGWNEAQEFVDPGDLGAQAGVALHNVERGLQAVGGSRNDVVSLRIYLVGEHIRDDRPVQEALRVFFAPDGLPAASFIGVKALANPDFLVEIEATAVLE